MAMHPITNHIIQPVNLLPERIHVRRKGPIPLANIIASRAISRKSRPIRNNRAGCSPDPGPTLRSNRR
ncbi:hypothetical protein [Chitinophaga rhizosphaerae]|uniref:hypothetical protein n=1 Tax=Chitinophaga rhizosphaerae TaxID=1864947 RepID=UPI000F807479|nr:hypothetical protein [Chitinophaga rhizosphaerae]